MESGPAYGKNGVASIRGAYTALPISRRLFLDRRHAVTAFGVHSGLLTVFVAIFVYVMAMAPYWWGRTIDAYEGTAGAL